MTAQFLDALTGPPFNDCFVRAGGARIDLWCLDRGNGAPTFLYGWVLPRRVQAGLAVTTGRTQVRDTLAVVTWSCAGPTIEVLALVRRLLSGELQEMGAPTLPVDVFVPGPLSYQLPPMRMHAWAARESSSPSPLADAPAYCISLVQPMKARLFEDVEQVVGVIIETLGKLVGFDFAGDHAARLGNLDAFAFPSANATEDTTVDFAFRGQTLAITIARTALSESIGLIIRCAEHAFGRVLSDRVRELAWRELDEPIVFAMSEDGPWVTYVDIWTVNAEQTSAPWYSNMFIPLRSLSMTTTAFSRNIPAPGWFNAWGTRTPADDIKARVRRLQQQEATPPASDYPPWASADLRAHELARLLAPATGGDRLVPGGFAELAAEDRLGELLAILAPSETSDVLLVDPMFDAYGLSLIAKVGFTQVNYHVLTTGSLVRGPAIDRMVQIARADILPVELGVVELADRAGAGIGCFLLMLNAAGDVIRGFQLSTSASTATCTQPLLINEIARSALPDVAELVKSFQRCDDKVVGPSARFTTLWPQAAQPAEPRYRKSEDVDVTAAITRLTNISDDDAWASAWEDAAERLATTPRYDEQLTRITPAIADRLRRLLSDFPRLARLPRRNERLSASSYFLLDALSSPISSQYHIAWDLVSRWHDRSTWWAVRYAVQALLATAPAAAIHVLDGWLEQLTTAADPSTATQIACVATALEQIVRKLHDLNDDIAAFEHLLLNSRHPLVRGIAVGSVGRRIVNDLAGEADLLLFTALEPREQVVALSVCVYHLRVRANRAGGESNRDQQIRATLFAALAKVWPHARPDLRDTVFRLEGPIVGGWSSSTTFDLLIPLVESGDLTLHEVIQLWANELRDRWAGMFSGRHHFYLDSDVALTELVAALLSHADSAEHHFLDEIVGMAAEARRVLDRPFSRSSSYNDWAHARDGLIWMRAFAQLLSAELRTRAEPLLAQVSVEASVQDIDSSNLYRFARDVDRRFTATAR